MSSRVVRTLSEGLVLVLIVAGCAKSGGQERGTGGSSGATSDGVSESGGREGGSDDTSIYVITEVDSAGLAKAIFAGGCFWCEETAFEGVPGVRAVISGFVGGSEAHPTYEQVSAGQTGHAEAVLVTYDDAVITYEKLLEIFWVNHDPTTSDRQFCDRGFQYRPGIFYVNDTQRRAAEASIVWAREHKRVNERIVTEITKAGTFWPAEVYHQDYWKKNPVRYKLYRTGCRRDARLDEIWGDAAEHG